MPLRRVWIPSPNFSATRQRTQLLVIHTTEGGRTFNDLGRFFQNPSKQVSSHVGIDDQDGVIGEFVRRQNKSWTACAANDWGLHAELVAYAEWDRKEWKKHPILLRNTSLWLREEAARFSIPLVKVTGKDILAGKKGVCGHKDVNDAGAGGNHWDPGPYFPWDLVLPAVEPPTHTHPSFPGRLMKLTEPMMRGEDIKMWQAQMNHRGSDIVPDGIFGPISDHICRQFQRSQHLEVDGIVGQKTWDASFTAP